MRTAHRTLVGLLLLALLPLLVVQSVSAAVLLEDGFETGTTSNWVSQVGADGSVTVDSDHVNSGSYAARLSATSSTGSYAYLRADLSSAQTALDVQVAVSVLAEGASGGNVPLLRLFDASGSRLVSVIRQNQSADKVYVEHGGTWVLTSARLPLTAWASLRLRVIVDGATSTVDLTVDGVPSYATTTASLTSSVATVQVGNEVRAQAFTLAADDVGISNHDGDVTPPDTSITAGPSGTSTGASASFEFVSPTDATATFQCSLDNAPWSSCTSPQSYTDLADGEHVFQVRAVDQAGNVDSSPDSRTWTVAVPEGSCDPDAPPPTTTDPGHVVVADGFEEPSFPQWTKVAQQGDAAVVLQQEVVRSAQCAVQVTVTDDVWDSRAYLTKILPRGTNEVWVDGWFNVRKEGLDSNWNVPTFRVQSNGKRVFDVSRQNVTGNVFVRFPKVGGGWTYLQTGRRMGLNRWYRVKAHVVANGNLSTVEVWLDGTRYVETSSATLGVTTLDVLMVGAEHQGQEGVFAADDVVVKAVVPPPTDVVFQDGFESGGLAAWITTATGGGGVETQTAVVRAGSLAARLTSPTTSSAAAARAPLGQAYTDLTTAADVHVLAEGAKGTTVPLMTMLDPGGAPLVSVHRVSQSGSLLVRHSGVSTTVPVTLPLGTWARLTARAVAAGSGASTVEITLDGSTVHATGTASLGTSGTRTIMVGGSSSVFDLVVDEVLVTKGTAGPVDDPDYKLLIADHLNKRLLITDFSGRVVWKFDNPAGQDGYTGGPLGVRWLPGNQILATFGTGEVGVIDVASKTWVWQTKGYGGDWFQSPYDAELLPDGRLAVALRVNSGGRISIYDRPTGTEIWRHLLSNAHSVHYRSAEDSWNSEDPTMLVGGWGSIREVSYRGTAAQTVTWQVKSEYTHDVMALPGNTTLLTTEGYYIQKIDRVGSQLWKRSTPDENRRIAMNPNDSGGYIYTVAESDRIEFRDEKGNLLRDWSRLSDDTILDYPYGLAVIHYPG